MNEFINCKCVAIVFVLVLGGMIMTSAANLIELVPHMAPNDGVERTLLIAIRRIAIGGLTDASAANLLLSEFGLGYRRPLMFLRIMMAEISRISHRQISIAPCCCLRMTMGEAGFLSAVRNARRRPADARAQIALITGTFDCLAALSVAQALGNALEDIGRPLRA
jgi:hypothetical protein